MTVPPVSVDVGSQNVGTSSSPQQLTVTNAGIGVLKIISVGAAGDFLDETFISQRHHQIKRKGDTSNEL